MAGTIDGPREREREGRQEEAQTEAQSQSQSQSRAKGDGQGRPWTKKANAVVAHTVTAKTCATRQVERVEIGN